MANWKRKKPRAKVRCLLCTGGRFTGNSLSKYPGRRPKAAQKFWPKIEIEIE